MPACQDAPAKRIPGRCRDMAHEVCHGRKRTLKITRGLASRPLRTASLRTPLCAPNQRYSYTVHTRDRNTARLSGWLGLCVCVRTDTGLRTDSIVPRSRCYGVYICWTHSRAHKVVSSAAERSTAVLARCAARVDIRYGGRRSRARQRHQGPARPALACSARSFLR